MLIYILPFNPVINVGGSVEISCDFTRRHTLSISVVLSLLSHAHNIRIVIITVDTRCK